ncbi:mechanosensitive ion channel domain-containing protein [Cerasicoccus frondis]|uniref:mechanosensitive ion channel domain-containing protein n=1 Tax=Cerasicoccus frondis TaxID=490090 RepID=UPI0028528A1A|nr:mechanosensitive ion channel domain-containing protein [Cerasicoccus frondis]
MTYRRIILLGWLIFCVTFSGPIFAAGKDTSGGSESNNSLVLKAVRDKASSGDEQEPAADSVKATSDVDATPSSDSATPTSDAASPAAGDSSAPASDVAKQGDTPSATSSATDSAANAASSSASKSTAAKPATTADKPDAIDNVASDAAKVVTGQESVAHEANKYETLTKQAFEKYGPGSIEALVIFICGYLVAKLLRSLFVRFGSAQKWDEAITEYLGLVIFISVLVMFTISALKALGFPVNSMLASFGITGVIIGLGVRAQLNNYFAGVAMLAARPFHKGDLIEFGPPFQIGVVQNVYMSSTVLDTLDNVRIVVPNGVLWRNMIKNYSSNQERTIRFDLTINPALELAYVRDLASQVLLSNEHILKNPAPELDVAEVTPDGVRAVLKAKCRANAVQVFTQLVEDLRSAFEEAGMQVKLPAKGVKLKVEE